MHRMKDSKFTAAKKSSSVRQDEPFFPKRSSIFDENHESTGGFENQSNTKNSHDVDTFSRVWSEPAIRANYKVEGDPESSGNSSLKKKSNSFWTRALSRVSSRKIFRRRSQDCSFDASANESGENSSAIKPVKQMRDQEPDIVWYEKLKYDARKETNPEPCPPRLSQQPMVCVEYEEIVKNNIVNELATRKTRSNSLFVKMMLRSEKEELEQKNILHDKSAGDTFQSARHHLIRRFSLRPERDVLIRNNYVKQYSNEELQRIKEDLKAYLNEKLTSRPPVQKLIDKKIFRFNDVVAVTTTISYNRRGEKPWIGLSNRQKALIRKELNDFKLYEMEVHEESKKFTRFH